MQGNRRTDTQPEVALRSLLHRRGLRFRKDHPVDVGGRRVRPDIVFPAARVAVFVDGCYWHGCLEHKTLPKTNTEFWAKKISGNVARDREVDHALSDVGWLVLRFWEHEEPVGVSDAVEKAVRRRRADHVAAGRR
jgi:DNA mismatch endonuclease (patch repair protein)